MKTMPSAWSVMEALTVNITAAYALKPEQALGSIQFLFTHENESIPCALVADGTSVKLVEGPVDNPVVTLRSSFYDWLDLAGNKLRPASGVMSGKLKFSGNTSFFSKVMPDVGFWEKSHDARVEDPPRPFEIDPVKNWKKPMHVLVINGSPRGGRGYTTFYQNAFIEGLEQAGTKVETVYLRQLKIKACTGCWQCWLKGSGECVFAQQDDFKELQTHYEEADLVVFSFPLYSDGMPGLLKDFFDRCVCFEHPFMVEGPARTRHPRRVQKDRAMVVLSICGFIEDENFNAVRDHFRQISHNNHMPIVAEVFRSGAMYLYNQPILFRQLTSVLDALQQAGREVAEGGKVARKTQKLIAQQLTDGPMFRTESNHFWSEKLKNSEIDY
jgi:multimeric flavodoxin WrbA/putative sterol carrier protein